MEKIIYPEDSQVTLEKFSSHIQATQRIKLLKEGEFEPKYQSKLINKSTLAFLSQSLSDILRIHLKRTQSCPFCLGQDVIQIIKKYYEFNGTDYSEAKSEEEISYYYCDSCQVDFTNFTF